MTSIRPRPQALAPALAPALLPWTSAALLGLLLRNKPRAVPLDTAPMRRILLFRYDAIGDMIVTTAVIEMSIAAVIAIVLSDVPRSDAGSAAGVSATCDPAENCTGASANCCHPG